MTTTDGKLYLTALRSLERLDIQFVPQSLSPTRSVKWAEIAIVGRNNPLHHYTGGNNELMLELDFHAANEDREDVIAKCRLLESWAMNDGYANPPERIRLTFGRLFKENEIWVINSLDFDYSQFSPEHGMLPVQAYARVGLKMDTDTNRTKADVQWR